MTAAVGGLDLLVLTDGVGEHSGQVRSALAKALGYLGVSVDAAANERTTADGDISGPDAAVRTVVVTAREDLAIRRQVLDLLAES